MSGGDECYEEYLSRVKVINCKGKTNEDLRPSKDPVAHMFNDMNIFNKCACRLSGYVVTLCSILKTTLMDWRSVSGRESA
jgi:hypothetical protein